MAIKTSRMYPKNDQTITLTGLAPYGTKNYLSAATVTVTLVDANGNAVTGATNITLTAVGGSPGTYNGPVAYTFNPAPGTYTLQITAVNAGQNFYGERKVQVLQQPV